VFECSVSVQLLHQISQMVQKDKYRKSLVESKLFGIASWSLDSFC
jgi:hypothetical protein